MELIGFNGDILMGVTQPSLSAASLQTNIIPNSYGLSIQPNSNSQIASIQFDAATGWLAIAGNANNNIVKQTITGNGYYQFDIDGQLFSSDRSSASFWESLDGATSISVVGIDFDGGLGDDTLIIGSQEMINFGAIADDTIQIQGEVHGESLFFKAKDIINQGSIIASNITAEFSNSYSDVADAKIIAIDGGNILLNGGKTGDLQATGQFLATGLTGGKIDFRGKTVSLRGANLDASGQNGGGSILIGGDYQGVDPTGLGTLSNAQFTFVDKYSSINVDAMTRGNGGKVIIWSDGDTDFRGNITARGGLEIGDGGFVEVSGKKNLNFVGQVDVNATNGKQGSILLDPEDIIINPDDDDDSTFDVSDLQKLRGNVTLTATNSIVFNTNTYFINSGGTITLQAPTVNLLGTFGTGGRNLNVSGASIYGMGHINSSSYAGQSGYIKLTSSGGINLGKYAISTNSVQGSGGNITLKANTFITTGLVDTGANGNGNGGNVNLSATAGIFTSTIVTHSTGSGKSGNILLQSTLGSINTTNSSFDTDDRLIYAAGNGGSAGSVTLTAYSDIVTNSIRASSNGGAGNTIKLTSLMGKIDTNGGEISTYSNNSNAGNVILNACDIAVGKINSSSYAGQSGYIKLTSSGGINLGKYAISTNSVQGSGGNITLKANTFITTGLVDTGANGNGNGGNVNLSATAGIFTSTIVTHSTG
ncbi:MAG: beta strand repeat-containing protein, partial [Pseudanabaena sp.]